MYNRYAYEAIAMATQTQKQKKQLEIFHLTRSNLNFLNGFYWKFSKQKRNDIKWCGALLMGPKHFRNYRDRNDWSSSGSNSSSNIDGCLMLYGACMRVSCRMTEVDKFLNSFDGQTTERIYLIKYTLLIYNDGGKKTPNGTFEILQISRREVDLVHSAQTRFTTTATWMKIASTFFMWKCFGCILIKNCIKTKVENKILCSMESI